MIPAPGPDCELHYGDMAASVTQTLTSAAENEGVREVSVATTLRTPKASDLYHTSSPENPQGKRKRGRPRNTWRRDLQAETEDGLHAGTT